MEYIDVDWIQSHIEYPIRLVSELDNERFEVRKLEFFQDGTVGFASNSFSTENTKLGLIAVPNLNEINLDSQFRGKVISKDEFDSLWQKYAT